MRKLRDRVRAVLHEGVNEDHLDPVWVQVRGEWITLFPESRHVIDRLDNQRPEFALTALLGAMDEYLEDKDKAAGYREEKTKFEQLQKELGAAFGKIRK